MIFPEPKISDMKIRDHILEAALVAARMYEKTGEERYLGYANELITASEKLQVKIKTYDYSKDEPSFKRIFSYIHRKMVSH